MISYQEKDLNRTLAHDAHRGTSFTPEVRAQQEIEGEYNNVSTTSE